MKEPPAEVQSESTQSSVEKVVQSEENNLLTNSLEAPTFTDEESGQLLKPQENFILTGGESDHGTSDDAFTFSSAGSDDELEMDKPCAPDFAESEAAGCCKWQKQGELTLLCGTVANPICILGPDWNLLMITYLLIVGISLAIYFFMMPHGAWAEEIIGLILLSVVVGSLTVVAFSNPGIVQWHPIPKSERWTFCDRCRSYRPPRSIHCNECKVCIEGYDHHCPWTSKCVGKKNLKVFHVFLLSTMVLIVYNITIAVRCLVQDSGLVHPHSDFYALRSY